MDSNKTRVVLRRFCGEVIALFPDIDEGLGNCLSYARIGQHGAASRTLTRVSRPVDASEPDAAALVRELTALGYNLHIVKRMTPQKPQQYRTSAA
jgi:hypothetical protein